VADFRNILVIQTAFPGDVILTIPLVQSLKKEFPAASVDMLVTPQASEVLLNHPSIRNILRYDKHGDDRGISGFRRQTKILRSHRYDLAIIPHRSLRSALLVRLAGIPLRVGFSTSAGSFFFTQTVPYDSSSHEVDRNLSLLRGIGITVDGRPFPEMYPTDGDRRIVDDLLPKKKFVLSHHTIAIAPGSVWNTKRWMPERFQELIRHLIDRHYSVVLLGGKDDVALCERILESTNRENVISMAGELTFLQSAELIRRSRVLVSNDSAPMHLALAMRTPVVAIFGPTVPRFGFAPYGINDSIVEISGLACRPCSIHGGATCPIKTFDCMVNISAETVFQNVVRVMEKQSVQSQ